MKIQSRPKKIIYAFVAFFFFGLGSAYLSAYVTLDKCSALVYAEAKKSNISVRDFDGRTFTYRDIEVHSRIDGPFQVSTTFSVPNGFHAIIYEYKYWGIFGHPVLRSHENVHLL